MVDKTDWCPVPGHGYRGAELRNGGCHWCRVAALHKQGIMCCESCLTTENVKRRTPYLADRVEAEKMACYECDRCFDRYLSSEGG